MVCPYNGACFSLKKVMKFWHVLQRGSTLTIMLSEISQTGGCVKRGKGGYCLKDTEFWFEKMNKDGGDYCIMM